MFLRISHLQSELAHSHFSYNCLKRELELTHDQEQKRKIEVQMTWVQLEMSLISREIDRILSDCEDSHWL